MAEKIVNSIFGVDPAMYSQLKNQQNYADALAVGNQYAVPGTMMNPSLGPLYTQAAQQGQLIGGGVGTLLGAQDPELQKITAIKQLSTQFDLTSPTGMREFSRALQQIAPNESIKAAKRADEMTQATLSQTKTSSEITKNLADNIKQVGQTPQGYQVYQSGNEQFVLGPDGQRFSYTGPLASKTPSSRTEIKMAPNESEYAKEVGQATAKRDVAQYDSASTAAENLNKINETLNELKTSDAITGSLADIQKNITKVKAKFTADKAAGKQVTDTEYLDALLGSDVFAMIKPLGIGARGLDTPAEREFLRRVMTGEIGLEKDTLIKMTETRKNIAERTVKSFNDRVDSGELDKFFSLQGRKAKKIDIPTFSPPTDIYSKVRQNSGWATATKEEIDAAIQSGKIKTGKQ